jgi:hypothetical protein
MARARTLPQVESESATRDEGQAPISMSGSLQVFAALLAPGTLIGALMFYFGWVRTHSFYAYFGIDADTLGLSTTDYVLRSADALWPPLGSLVVLILLTLLTHWVVNRWINRVQHVARLQHRLAVPLLVLGMTLSAVGIFRFATGLQSSVVTPLCFAIGFGFLAYAWLIHRYLAAELGLDRAPRASSQRIESAVFGLFVLLIILNVFWATALFARDLGQGRAQRFELQQFATRPDVLLYTSHRLYIDAHNVTEKDLGPTYSPYRYRYDGFKLLIRGTGRLVLIPYSWSTGNAFALVLPEGNDIRIVFAPNFEP